MINQRTAYQPPKTTMEITREQMLITRIDQKIRVEFTGRVIAVRKVESGLDRHYEVDMIAEDDNALQK